MILPEQLVRPKLSLKEAIQGLLGPCTLPQEPIGALGKIGASLDGQEVRMAVCAAGAPTKLQRQTSLGSRVH